MNAEKLRYAMLDALIATGADGAYIDGTEAEVRIVLTFNRSSGEVVVDDRGPDGPDCGGSSMVASEVSRRPGETELPRHNKHTGG